MKKGCKPLTFLRMLGKILQLKTMRIISEAQREKKKN